METVQVYDLKTMNNTFNDLYKELIDFAKDTKFKETYLLNMPHHSTDENKNYIEKFVYDSAVFQLSEYNIKHNTNINIEDIFIEFWSLQDTHFKKMHFDKDEQDYLINNNYTTYNKPFLSCITYLNDDIYAPTLITDIVRPFGSPYEIEDVSNGVNTNFGMVFPKKMKQVTFDGGKYFHGMYLFDDKCSNRLVLPINFWLKKPKYLSYFPYYSYIKKKYSYEEIILLSNKHSIIDYNKPLLFFYKLNMNKLMKKVDVPINKDNVQVFDAWYKHLIFGHTPVKLLFLNEYLTNDAYVYYFNFIFNLDQ